MPAAAASVRPASMHMAMITMLRVVCAMRMAKDEGVLVAVSSDAHGVDGLDVLRFGVGQARRGWLEAADVLNARPLPELRRLLAKVRR